MVETYFYIWLWIQKKNKKVTFHNSKNKNLTIFEIIDSMVRLSDFHSLVLMGFFIYLFIFFRYQPTNSTTRTPNIWWSKHWNFIRIGFPKRQSNFSFEWKIITTYSTTWSRWRKFKSYSVSGKWSFNHFFFYKKKNWFLFFFVNRSHAQFDQHVENVIFR